MEKDKPKNKSSECCSADVILGVCTNCGAEAVLKDADRKNNADITYQCQDCKGLGQVSVMETLSPSEPHLQAPVGSEPCERCNGTGRDEF